MTAVVSSRAAVLTPRPPAIRSLHRVTELVGRDAEQRRLDRALDDARDGRSTAIVVFGAAGVGKTSLMEWLCGQAEQRAMRTLRVSCAPNEAAVPFAGLDALVRPLLVHLDALPAAQVAAVRSALALDDNQGAGSFALGAGTISLLASAAESTPVLVAVDDAQWLDPPSRDAVVFAARRLRAEGIAMVLTYRAEQPPAALHGVEQLPVAALDQPRSEALVRMIAGPRLPEATAQALAIAGAGNPLVLAELVRGLTAEERDGRAALVGPPRPIASADLFADRIRMLPDPARRALLLLATVDDGADHLLGELLDAGGARDHLLVAEEAGLVELQPSGPVMRHPLVRSSSYHGATPAERRAAHAAVADAMATSDSRRPWHLAAAAAAPDETIAAALERTAARARHRGAGETAARTMRRAADMSPDETARGRRLLRSAEDFAASGALTEARLMLDDAACARTGSEADAMRARLDLHAGRPAEAIPVLVAHARALAGSDPQAAAQLLRTAAFGAMQAGSLDDWLEHASSAVALLEPVRGPAYLGALSLWAAGLVASGRAEEATDPMLEAEAGLLAAADRPADAPLEEAGLLAHAFIWTDRFDRGERLLSMLLEQARRSSRVASLPYLLIIQTALMARVGRLQAGAAAITEAVELAEDTGQESVLLSALGMSGIVHAFLGDEGACKAAAERARELSDAAAGRQASITHTCLGHLALARGDVADAAAHLDRAAGVQGSVGFAEPGSQPWVADHAEALARLGREAEARERLAPYVEAAERLGRASALGQARRVEGLLADDAEFECLLRESEELLAGAGLPGHRAQSLLCLGERLRRARRPTDAREPLRVALEVFDATGQQLWARRARVELRAAGGAVPTATPKAGADLTPHEVQVALMAAEGRTNREVAAALFLAPKTVEHHLSAIYRKLGIKRRTELARVFARELAESASSPATSA